jgi:hypothetical protein
MSLSAAASPAGLSPSSPIWTSLRLRALSFDFCGRLKSERLRRIGRTTVHFPERSWFGDVIYRSDSRGCSRILPIIWVRSDSLSVSQFRGSRESVIQSCSQAKQWSHEWRGQVVIVVESVWYVPEWITMVKMISHISVERSFPTKSQRYFSQKRQFAFAFALKTGCICLYG